jgi:hypothetical protein
MVSRFRSLQWLVPCAGAALVGVLAATAVSSAEDGGGEAEVTSRSSTPASRHAAALLDEGEHTFRFDTFGDERFWGAQLRLHEVLAQLSPRSALALGLKVDVEALPRQLIEDLQQGEVDLEDPAVTRELLRRNAVLGAKGFFSERGALRSVGFTCAICHSTVDDSLAAGIGRRLDGWANRDLNIGAIIATAPNVRPFVELLRHAIPSADEALVRRVFNSWGPGKFDAQLLLDGKAFQPDGRSSAATMIPNAYGLAGFNQHTWTGGWGSVPYWNAFVAVLEMGGVGTFYDPRLDDSARFPIAAAARFGHREETPANDRVTGVLPALHFYQLALPAPRPRARIDYNPTAARRGELLFEGKAKCNDCHRSPLWTEPGWNVHTPAELRIDSFQAERSPGGTYKTMNLAGLFVRERGLFMKPENRGRFYHDGRFRSLLDVVRSYDERFALGLSESEERELVEYLKSL